MKTLGMINIKQPVTHCHGLKSAGCDFTRLVLGKAAADRAGVAPHINFTLYPKRLLRVTVNSK